MNHNIMYWRCLMYEDFMHVLLNRNDPFCFCTIEINPSIHLLSFYTPRAHTHTYKQCRTKPRGSSTWALFTLVYQREAEQTHAGYLATAAGLNRAPTWLQHQANKAPGRLVSQWERICLRPAETIHPLAAFSVMHCEVQINTYSSDK